LEKKKENYKERDVCLCHHVCMPQNGTTSAILTENLGYHKGIIKY